MASSASAQAGVPRAKPRPPRRIPWRGTLLAVGAVALGATAAWGHDELRAVEQRPLRLRGMALPVDGDPAPFVRQLAHDWLETEITIDAGSQVVHARRRELGAHLDVDGIVHDAQAARGLASMPVRIWLAASGPQEELPFRMRIDDGELRTWAEGMRRRVEVPPRAIGRSDPGRPGVAPILDRSIGALHAAIASDSLYVQMPLMRLAPPERLIADGANIFREVMGAYETRYGYQGDSGQRAVNVELATGLLDGAIVAPDGELSFNAIVGERTLQRGFLPATELDRGGRRVDGVGGGVCQVAATLHAVAFFAGFEIVEHHPHTRNSSYIDPGLDSAVSWPGRDLRVRNPFPFSVRVRASAVQGHLRIVLMGARGAPRVDWSTRVLSHQTRTVEREVDPNLPMGAVDVIDEGEDGSVLERTRIIHWADGDATETVELHYPMVSRLTRVGPSALRGQ